MALDLSQPQQNTTPAPQTFYYGWGGQWGYPSAPQGWAAYQSQPQGGGGYSDDYWDSIPAQYYGGYDSPMQQAQAMQSHGSGPNYNAMYNMAYAANAPYMQAQNAGAVQQAGYLASPYHQAQNANMWSQSQYASPYAVPGGFAGTSAGGDPGNAPSLTRYAGAAAQPNNYEAYLAQRAASGAPAPAGQSGALMPGGANYTGQPKPPPPPKMPTESTRTSRGGQQVTAQPTQEAWASYYQQLGYDELTALQMAQQQIQRQSQIDQMQANPMQPGGAQSATPQGQVYSMPYSAATPDEQNQVVSDLARQTQEAFDAANQANEQRYQDILGGYQTREEAANALVQALGASQAEDINRSYAQSQAGMRQNMVDRGLFNTTVLDSSARGIESDRQKSLRDLTETIARIRLGTMLGTSGDRLGFMERRNDVGPDPMAYANLMMQMGAGGVGTGFVPQYPMMYPQPTYGQTAAPEPAQSTAALPPPPSNQRQAQIQKAGAA